MTQTNPASKLAPYALILLGGILFVLSFAPWDYGCLQWLAWAPLFFGIHLIESQFPFSTREEKKTLLIRIALAGYLMSATLCLGGYYWIIHATQEYGGLPFIGALALFAVFCIIGQLQLPIFLLIRHHIKKHELFRNRPWLWIFLSGWVYVGVDSFYPKLFLDTAGHAFYRESHFRQVADIGGPFFLSACSVIIGEMLYYACKALSAGAKKVATLSFVLTALLLSSIYAYGAWRLGQVETLRAAQVNAPSLNISMIQANIGDYLKVEAERGGEGASRQVISQYLNLSQAASLASPKPDAILWPETAYPGLFGHPAGPSEVMMENAIRSFAKDFGAWTLFGGYDQQNSLDYNSLFFYHATRADTPTYHKNILLMFGETLPFAETFPQMKGWFPTMGFFGRGPGPQAFTIQNRQGKDFKFAPSICYEGLFPEHSAEGAFLGADALLNITNDSWFGEKGEPYLHLELTTFRSIETRLPMIRSTNTGFTVVIDSTGEIIQTTKMNSSEFLSTEIKPRLQMVSPFLAVARIFGNQWFARLCQIITALLLFATVRRKNA